MVSWSTSARPAPPATMQSGAVERMYRVFRDISPAPLCIVAGGAGRALVDQLTMPRRYVENLVLDGLARIAIAERAVAK